MGRLLIRSLYQLPRRLARAPLSKRTTEQGKPYTPNATQISPQRSAGMCLISSEMDWKACSH